MTIVRTAASSQSPAPASSVSVTWSSKESSSLVTQAMPPWATAVLESTPFRFVITATEPCWAAFRANVNPAIPLPMTTKSYCFTTNERYRLAGSGQKMPPPPGEKRGQLRQLVAGCRHLPARDNRFGPGAPSRLHSAPPQEFLPLIVPPLRTHDAPPASHVATPAPALVLPR